MFINILEMNENKDGSADLEIEYDHEFKALIEAEYPDMEFKQAAHQFVVESLEDWFEKNEDRLNEESDGQ